MRVTQDNLTNVTSVPHHSALWRYAAALLIVGLALLIRWPLYPWLGDSRPYLTLFGGVAVAVWFARWRAATVAAAVGFVVANWWLAEPQFGFRFRTFFAFELAGYALSAGSIIFVGEMMHRARERETEQKNLVSITLASIGDAVIATNVYGHVTFLNAEAERLTGWKSAEAIGSALSEVFHIVNEKTGRPAEDPVERVLRTGKVVALANHTVLIARDGRRTPIDDSAAPIRYADGSLSGVVLVFRDVTTQRRAQEASERLAAIIEFSGDAIFTKDLNGIIRTWNASAERIFGYRPDEIIGKPVTVLFPQDRVGEEDHIIDLLRQAQPCEKLETIRLAKDGRAIPVLISVSPLKDEEGNVVGASKIVHDMSEILAAREALIREKELLGTTLASIGDGVIVTDSDGRVTFLNAEAERLTGWKTAEATGRALPDIFHIINEQSRQVAENPVEKVLRMGTVVGLANHTVLITKDRREIPIDDSAAPIRSPNGPLFGVVLVFRDFSQRKKAEEIVRQNEERLHGIISSAMDAVITIDSEQRIVLFNPAAEKMFGFNAADLVGQKIDRLIPERLRTAHRDHVSTFGRTGTSNRRMGALGAINGIRANGEEFPIEASISQVEVAGEKLLTVILRDITERKQGEEALEQAKRNAEEANRAKDHFLAMLSHDLRTPLTPVLMTAIALEADSRLDSEVRDQLSMMRRNVELEAKLIDDLLDVSRIAHGRFEIRNEPVDLHAAIEHALGISTSELNAKKLRVTKRFDASEHFCRGDVARLHEVFWNLLRNAVKFTPENGDIVIATRNDERRRVFIEIRDTGIGIEPELQARIFDAFEQGGPAIRARYGGLGLGLAISKRIVNLHNGTITVQSAGRNRGATFTIVLDALDTSTLQRPVRRHTPDVSRRVVASRILVVEDHKDTATVLRRLLQSTACTVNQCGTIAEAKKLAAEEEFDLVICDIGLPDGSGLDLMRHLREAHALTGIALSGFGTQEDMVASRQAGFAVHLTKPVNLDVLRTAVAELLESRQIAKA